MKNQKETEKTVIFKEKEWYRGKVVDIVRQIEDELSLKQIYTVTITLKEMLDEEKRG